MAIAPFENALLQKFGDSGSDGPGGTGIENDSRTPSLEVGGHTFTVVLKDSAGVQDDIRVQVNNANPVDPNKPHHAASLQEYANVSTTTVLIKDGVFDPADPTKETSAAAADFATNWIDIPGAGIDTTDIYVSSGSWRYMRLVTTDDMNSTLSAYVWIRDFSANI